MNKKHYKDYLYRFKYNPLSHIVIKTIRNTPLLYQYKTNVVALKRLYQKRRSCMFHDYCILSGRSKAVYSSFHLGRNFLKSLINEGKIPGWKKSSW